METVEEIANPQISMDGQSLIRLFSPRQVLIGAFLGGPPAATYLLKCNYDALENPKASKTTLLVGAIATLLLLALLPFLPEKMPNMVLPLAYSWGAYYLVEKLQYSKAQIEDSPVFNFQSVWKVVSAGLVSLVAFGAAAFAVVYLVQRIQGVEQGSSSKMVTYTQIPAVVEQLRQQNHEKAFVVFDFQVPNAKPGEDEVNIQYRIVNGKMTFLWLLLAKRNVVDKDLVLQWAQKNGVNLVEIQEGEVKILISQDQNIVPLGMSLIRDYYKLTPQSKIAIFEGVG